MASRVIEYVFKGNTSNLTSQITAAGKSVGSFADQLTAADEKGRKWRSGLNELGGTAGKIGLVAAAGFTAFVGTAARFDASMSAVSAATHETADNMALLRQAALDAGADTAFSAGEAAGAIEELAKAGVSTKDILAGGLTGALDLAAAGALDVGTAAEIAATTMTQFKLSGDQVSHVADLLAAGAGKAQGEVTDLGAALKQSGLVASQMGLSVEETVGTLGAFASAGLIGSDAGTSFRTMLLRLANPTKESADLMQRLGINAYDAQGNFAGMESLAGQLQGSLGGMTQAQRDATLATLFGSDAIRAASVLYSQGADGIATWTSNVDDAGYAAETAAARTDNLMGDLERLGGSLETAFISGGQGAQAPLRELIQLATQAVDVFSELPAPIQTATTGLLGVTAVLGGGAFFGAKVITGIADTRKALSDMGLSLDTVKGKIGGIRGVARAAAGAGGMLLLADGMRRVASSTDETTQAMGTLESAVGGAMAGFAVGGGPGALIGTVVGLLGSYVGASKAAADAADSFSDTLDRQNGALTENSRAWVVERLGPKNLQAFKDAGVNINELTDALLEGGPAARDYLDSLGIAGGEKGWAFRNDAEDAMVAARKLNGEIEQGKHVWQLNTEAMDENADAAGEVGDANEDAAGGVEQLGGAAGTAADQVQELTDAMKEQRTEALRAFDAETNLAAAFDDARASIKENGRTFDVNTEKGRKNRQALSDLASGWNDLDDATRNTPGRYEKMRRQFIDTGVAMGLTRKQAREYADEFLNIPDSKNTDVTATVDQAELDAFLNTLTKVPEEEKTNLEVDAATGTVRLHGEEIAKIPKKQLTNLEVDPETGKVKLHGTEIGKIPDSELTKLKVDPETGKVTLHGYEIGRIPGSKNTNLNVNVKGQSTLATLKATIESIPTSKTVRVNVTQSGSATIPLQTQVKRGLRFDRAEGGPVPGERHPYRDKVLIAAAPGEYVVSNRYGQVDKNAAALRAANAGARISVAGGYEVGGLVTGLHTIGIPGYAAGGTLAAGVRVASAYGVDVGSLAEQRQLRAAITALTGSLTSTKNTVATVIRDRQQTLNQAKRQAGKKVDPEERAYINAAQAALDAAKTWGQQVTKQADNKLATAQQNTTRALGWFTDALGKAKQALEDEKRARDELKASISAGLKSDLWAEITKPAVAADTRGVFSRTTLGAGAAGETRAPTIVDVNTRLRSDIKDAEEYQRLERQLRNRGVTGAALTELIAAGDIDRMRMMASATDAQLRTYNNLFNRRDTTVAAAARTGANVTGITAAINQTRGEVRTLNQTVNALKRQLNDAENARKREGRARQRNQNKQGNKNATATGKAVVKATNTTAKNAKKK